MRRSKRLRMPFVGDGLIRWGRFNAKTWTNGEDFDCLMTNRWKAGYVNRGSDVIVGNVAGDVMGSGTCALPVYDWTPILDYTPGDNRYSVLSQIGEEVDLDPDAYGREFDWCLQTGSVTVEHYWSDDGWED